MSNIREVEFTKPDPQPNPALIEMLERWTERVRSGEIVACGIAGVKPNGSVSTEWAGAAGGWLHHLISGAAILKNRILRENDL
jgi:hypothetical protein